MKERPITMSGPMVRAILGGSKTQTRRILTWKEGLEGPHISSTNLGDVRVEYENVSPVSLAVRRYDGFGGSVAWCCYGKPGDRLWVKETWADVNTDSGPALAYRADGLHFCSDDAFPVQYERYPKCNFTMWYGDLLRGEEEHKWRSSRFMPRWASRLTLEITEVRVQRLQEITHKDAIAEGCEYIPPVLPDIDPGVDPRSEFAKLWDSINGKREGCAWAENPWTWAISFKVVGE